MLDGVLREEERSIQGINVKSSLALYKEFGKDMLPGWDASTWLLFQLWLGINGQIEGRGGRGEKTIGVIRFVVVSARM